MSARLNWVGRVRIVSGVVLFAYVGMHLANHAIGLISLAAMEWVRIGFLFLWRNPLGTLVLYGGLTLHICFVLYSLYRRRSWRMKPAEALQIAVGFAIPPLLALHIIGNRGLHEFHDLKDTYTWVLMSLWVFDPMEGLRQSIVLVAAWLHGCLGLHFWLRLRPWYPRALPYAFAFALLLPVISLGGFMSAGREVEVLMQIPGWFDGAKEAINWPSDQAIAWAYQLRDQAWVAMVIALLVVLAARLPRTIRAVHEGRVRLTYPGGRQVTIAPGTSVLEASRLAGIPHASVCGGRGRCSTCRVRVVKGGEALAPPSADETRVLERVGVPPDVRLACQIRPTASLEVTPLLPPTATARDGFRRANYLEGSEREIAVMFADLRAFTKFSESKLPYDVVFVLNQYFRTMGEAIERENGRLDKFIGDGIMALFGIDSGAEHGCREAVQAARAMGAALDELNNSIADNLDEPFRMGIGIHVGTVIVGEMGYRDVRSVTAIGDAVNTASRLETMTKEFLSQLVLSAAVVERAGLDVTGLTPHEIEVRGRSELLTVYTFDRAADAPSAAAATAQAAAS
jgi:adenylate cyclase